MSRCASASGTGTTVAMMVLVPIASTAAASPRSSSPGRKRPWQATWARAAPSSAASVAEAVAADPARTIAPRVELGEPANPGGRVAHARAGDQRGLVLVRRGALYEVEPDRPRAQGSSRPGLSL